MKKNDYKEIFILKRMLEDAKIPFEWEDHTCRMDTPFETEMILRYHIAYPNVLCMRISAVEGPFTHGSELDLIEIMDTSKRGDVEGYLTAETVFNMIKKDYIENLKKKGITVMKKIKVVDKDTLELKEIEVEDTPSEITDDDYITELKEALGCDADEFYKKYRDYKTAEANFKQVCEPFKKKLIKIHESHRNAPSGVVVGGLKLIYVSPSTRSTVDTKKLKEEEPELAKKYTKTTEVAATIRLEEV